LKTNFGLQFLITGSHESIFVPAINCGKSVLELILELKSILELNLYLVGWHYILSILFDSVS